MKVNIIKYSIKIIVCFLYCSVNQSVSAVEEKVECSSDVVVFDVSTWGHWIAVYGLSRPPYGVDSQYENRGFFLEVDSFDVGEERLIITLRLAVFSRTKYVYFAHVSDAHNGALEVDFFGFQVSFTEEGKLSKRDSSINFRDSFNRKTKPIIIEQYALSAGLRQDTLRLVVSNESLISELERNFEMDPGEPIRLALQPFIYLPSLQEYQDMDLEEGEYGVYAERAFTEEFSDGAFKEVWFDLLLDGGRFKVLDQDDSEELIPDDSDEPETRE